MGFLNWKNFLLKLMPSQGQTFYFRGIFFPLYSGKEWYGIPTIWNDWRGGYLVKPYLTLQWSGFSLSINFLGKQYSALGSQCNLFMHVWSVIQLCADSVTPWAVACQAPLSMEFSKQEYWIGLSFPTLGDLPDPGIKPKSPVSPASAGEFFTTEPPGKPRVISSLTYLSFL